MKTQLSDYLPILLAIILFCSCTERNGNELGTAPVPLGDPFILLYEDTYYAYGTFPHSDDGIAVFTSNDLKVWKQSPDLALQKNDSWGERWFWAPEVYYIPQQNKFYMYYSADEHICVATATSPSGPFVQEEKKPMITGEKSIDASLYIDEDGTPYLYFNRFNDGLNIWVAELGADLQTLKEGTFTECINVSQPWEEVWPRVNEGAYVIKHKGLYYMTYSANSYESPYYGIGYATSASPLGPWTKQEKNPILQKPDTLVGVGHDAIFKDKNQKLRIVFHAHYNQQSVHPRLMYISDIQFTDEAVPAMKVNEKILRPTLVE